VGVGATDPTGVKTTPERPIEVPDLYATLYEAFGVDFTREFQTPIGRPMAICPGQPIEELLA
jgi:hypothetical protein